MSDSDNICEKCGKPVTELEPLTEGLCEGCFIDLLSHLPPQIYFKAFIKGTEIIAVNLHNSRHLLAYDQLDQIIQSCPKEIQELFEGCRKKRVLELFEDLINILNDKGILVKGRF